MARLRMGSSRIIWRCQRAARRRSRPQGPAAGQVGARYVQAGHLLMLLPRINAGTVVVQGLSRISGACGLLLLVQILKFV